MRCESDYFNLQNGDHDLMLPLHRTPRRAMQYMTQLRKTPEVHVEIPSGKDLDPSNEKDASELFEALLYGDAKFILGG